MSDRDTLVFANYDQVVGGPIGANIDGLVEKDFLITTSEAVETGYVGSSLVTYGDSNIPPVIFKGVRKTSDDKLVFAFLCRFSHFVSGSVGTSDDEILIALRPSPTTAGNERLIIINPVGGGGATGGTSVASSAANNIRTNSPPAAPPIFKKRNAGSWQPANPTGIEVKVRSWDPSPGAGVAELAWSIEVAVPCTAIGGGGAEWIDIPNHFGLFFALTKIIDIAGQGEFASQYTFPVGVANFQGFDPDFTTPTNIPWGQGFKEPFPAGVSPQGVYFVGGPSGIFCRQVPPQVPALSAHQIAASNNRMVAQLANDGTNNAEKVYVEFKLAHWGLPPADINLWARPAGLLPERVPTDISVPANPIFGKQVPAGNSTVEFETNSWTLSISTAAADLLPDPLPTTPPTTEMVTQREFFRRHRHQCMWAQAGSMAGGVNFRQSSVRRNMDFVNLSDEERDAVISGVGYEEPADGSGEHKFFLQTFCRRIVIQEVIDSAEQRRKEKLDDGLDENSKLVLTTSLQNAGTNNEMDNGNLALDRQLSRRHAASTSTTQFKDSVVFLWTTVGYRLTDKTVWVSGKRYPLLDNGCGTFGYVAHHTGVEDNFSWTFAGPGLGKFGPGVYGLKVPHNGSATIKTIVRADRDGPQGDHSPDIPKLDPKEWVPPVEQGGGHDDPKPPKPDDDKNGICGLIALGIIGVPLALAATQLFA